MRHKARIRIPGHTSKRKMKKKKLPETLRVNKPDMKNAGIISGLFTLHGINLHCIGYKLSFEFINKKMIYFSKSTHQRLKSPLSNR